MKNEKDFDFCSYNRDELIGQVKTKAAIEGFRAIIPFADRNNRFYASTSFACCMAGVSQRKLSSNCPFKITYVKQHQEGFYRMATAITDSFLRHNH